MKLKIVQSILLVFTVIGCMHETHAHELFLKTDNYQPPSNSHQVIKVLNGTFYSSADPVSRSRINDVTIIGNDRRKVRLTSQNWSSDATTSFLQYQTGDAGTRVIAMSTKENVLTKPRDMHIAHLKQAGNQDLVDEFMNSRAQDATERYSKHARAIVQVGNEFTDHYSERLKDRIEIIPAQNPYELHPGDRLSFQVLYKGKPAVNQYVRASYEEKDNSQTGGASQKNKLDMRTDGDGRAMLKIISEGAYYISTIYIEKANDPDVDYESNWATLTFAIN